MQKPHLSAETALQAAKAYYKTLKHEQQHQQTRTQPVAQTSVANNNKSLDTQSSSAGPNIEQGSSDNNDQSESSESNTSNANKIKSPTPLEILQRFQK